MPLASLLGERKRVGDGGVCHHGFCKESKQDTMERVPP